MAETTTAKPDENTKQYVLKTDQELRMEVESKTEKVRLELKQGTAEIFGTEIWIGRSYEFRCGAKIAIFTFSGCTLEISGKPDVIYIAKETPMTMYLNCHIALERLRKNAEVDDKRGPVTLIVGPCDVGKSTVSKILLNYGVRMGRRPTYVDLDVGQGNISVPGSIGAMLIERPACVESGFSQQAPLVYHFGHTSFERNIPLITQVVTNMAQVINDRLESNKKAKYSGIIINTGGWIRGEGYKQLLHMLKAFDVDVVLVIDQERLYNELQRDCPHFVHVVFLPKSRGVVERSRQNRAEIRNSRINEYFYGTPQSPLFPHSFDVKMSDLKVYKIGAPVLPDSCMPVGMKPEQNLTKIVHVNPSPDLVNHILAVSFAKTSEENVILTNVAGFICVTRVDTDKGLMTILSPQPRPLPDTLLLLSDVQFVDSHT